MRMLTTAEPKADANSFGARIRQLRDAKRLTQCDVAHQAKALLKLRDGRGFGVSYLSKIENEKQGFEHPSDAAIIALAKVLEADPDELLALAGRPPIGLGEKLANNPKA